MTSALAPATLHDHDAELFFQAAYGRGQGRLRHMASFSGFGEMFFAGKRDQIIELANEHSNLLPQILRMLPKFCIAFRLTGLLKLLSGENA